MTRGLYHITCKGIQESWTLELPERETVAFTGEEDWSNIGAASTDAVRGINHVDDLRFDR